MKSTLDENQPLFQQIAQIIIDDILDGYLQKDDQLPSENEMARFYDINRATVRKWLQVLIERNYIYKKRGVGMFVAKGAYQELIKERQKKYRHNHIIPLWKSIIK